MTMKALNYFGRCQTNWWYCNLIVLFVLILGWQPALAGTTPPPISSFNPTQINYANTIGTACPQGPTVNSSDFQDRCDRLIGANGSLDLAGTTDSEVMNGIQVVGAGQSNSPGAQANKTMAGNMARVNAGVSARIHTVRAGLTDYAGIQLYRNGETLLEDSDTGFRSGHATGGAASGDSVSGLGVWAHGIYNFGSVESSFDEIGFKFDTWGTTVGADYLFTDDFFLGAAFSYLGSDNDYGRSGGGFDSDSYIGSIYGSFYITDNFYIDGIASYGGVEYDISRNISYTIPGDIVNTVAKGSPDGDQYSFGFGTGYDIVVDAVSVTPYARVNYSEGEVDSYNESGGSGWAQHFSMQRFRSLTTALGAQASHAWSIPWGVVTTQVHGEWLHEYKDSQREYSTSFLGDGNSNQFKLVTGNPDRNYFIVGVGFTGTFAHGISAYINYDTLLDYNNVSSHRIILGGRMEF